MNNQKNKEKSRPTESEKDSQTSQSYWSDNMSQMMNTCCMGGKGSMNRMGSMGQCCRSFMKMFWWFALIPLLFAGSALLLGYYLSAESILVLWMVGWGIVLGIGILTLIAIRIFYARFHLPSCCEQPIQEESE